MTVEKAGRTIWHDPLTGDMRRSMSFYHRVAEWTYKAEHAIDIVWGGAMVAKALCADGEEIKCQRQNWLARLSSGGL